MTSRLFSSGSATQSTIDHAQRRLLRRPWVSDSVATHARTQHISNKRFHLVGAEELASARGLALLTVLLDVVVSVCVWLAASGWRMEDRSSWLVIAPWTVLALTCSAAFARLLPPGGFSSQRHVSGVLAASLRCATTCLAVCIVVSIAFRQEQHELDLVAGVLVLTFMGGLGRVVLVRLLPPRVLVVTPESYSLPAIYRGDAAARHLAIPADTLGDHDRLVALISESARAFNACAVEVVEDLRLSGPQWRCLSWKLREPQVSLRLALEAGPLHQRRVRCAVRNGRAVVEVSAPVQTLGARCAKRTMDVAGSVFLIIALSPLLALLPLVIKVTSTGPALYKQLRVGRDGGLFTILKFRSMTAGSDGQLIALLAAQPGDTAPRFKVDNDPRITRVGAFLRRYSLDELPQLFNVLTGSMSLVGPRPQEPAEVALYRGDDGHRLGVRPGMTGLWQVSGRSRLSWEAARRLDVDYAHNWSIWGDLHILARTARAVIGADGAKWGQ